MKNKDNEVSCSGVITKLIFVKSQKVDGMNIPPTFFDKLAIIGRVNIGLLFIPFSRETLRRIVRNYVICVDPVAAAQETVCVATETCVLSLQNSFCVDLLQCAQFWYGVAPIHIDYKKSV